MIRVMTEKGLSGNALKVIAIVAMTIDHLAWVGIETYEQAETPTQIFLHTIGRLTAPMMIFFVAEGYHHTHDFRRYLRRRLLHIPQSHLRHGPPGLLAGSTAAGDVQRPARTAEVARQVLLLLLSRPHGGNRPAGPLLPITVRSATSLVQRVYRHTNGYSQEEWLL